LAFECVAAGAQLSVAADRADDAVSRYRSVWAARPLNTALSPMRNTAANSDDKISLRSILLIVGAFVVAGLLTINSVYFPQTRELSGVVQNLGSVDSGIGQGRGGGNREYASIKLQSGTIVLARVVSGGVLSVGENVKVLEQKRFIGPAIFQVVSIEPRP
jgi:hypothetical protein